MKILNSLRFNLAAIPAAFLLMVTGAAQAATSTDAVPGITFVQWTVASGGNGHYYGITSTATDWNTAEGMAVSDGGTLAAINSAAEQTFINNTFLASGPYNDLPLWIGLNDIANGVGSKNYTNWVTGEPVTYTNWNAATGEPTNSPPGEDYVAINWHYSLNNGSPLGTWNDTPEAGTTGYGGNSNGGYFGIVEVIPEPSAYWGVLTAGAGLCLLGWRQRARAARIS